MRSLTLRWLVLLFTVAWFGVLVPVHQRGAIQQPGSAAPSCCTHRLVAGVSCPGGDSQKSDAPAKGSSGNCAVCYRVFGLDLPAPVMLDVPPLGLAEPV